MFSGRTLGLVLVLCAAQRALAQEEPKDPKLAGHERMLRVLAELGERMYRSDPNFGRDKLDALRAQLHEVDDGTPTVELLQLYPTLGLQELIHGNNQEAVELLEKAHTLALALPEDKRPRGLSHLTYNLAVACMRLGETQNCIARHTSQSCILPIEGSGVHTDGSGSRRAIGYLTEVLTTTEPESDMNLGARWLLNIAHMTLGEWPGGVPEQYRIPPATFASDAEFPRFHDIAPQLGVNTLARAGGVGVEDFDGDGLLDLFVTTQDLKGQARFFHHQADGGFEDRTVAAGLEGILGGLNLTQADHDDDGDVDLLILRGGWQLGLWGQHPKSLLENLGPKEPGRFRDVSFVAGLGEEFYPSQTAEWADYDLDGDLDLYVGNEASMNSPFPSQLFRNRGDGTYEDVSAAAGVTNMRMAKGVSWGDIDGDRDPDLYVSNYLDANRLYENRGDGKFADVAPERGVTRPFDSFPCWFWDFDNDGALDIFVSTYELVDLQASLRLGPVAASYLGLPFEGELACLYKGDGKGGFRDVAVERNIKRLTLPMGSNYGDLDNDGFLDFYLGTGYPAYDGLIPNVLYWNRGGEKFLDVSAAAGVGHLQKGHGVGFGDLDRDGDLDLFEQMGGAYPGDGFGDALYENPGFGNHWLAVELTGVASIRSAIGARIHAEFEEKGSRRHVWRWVCTGSSFGANPLEQHLGLGRAKVVARLEIYWPKSDTTQVFENVPADTRLEIVEGAKEYRVTPTRAFALGKKP